MSAKKAHEIESLAPVIHTVCEKENVEVIVDIGTGGVSINQRTCINIEMNDH